MQRSRPTFFIFTHENTHAWTIGDSLNKLPKGSCGVVFRAYNLRPKDRLTLGYSLAQLCRIRRLLFLVAIRNNNDLLLATQLCADGLHLPEWVARQNCLAPILGWCRSHGRILTVAAHGSRGLTRGRQLHAFAVFLSPVFSTEKYIFVHPIGLLRFSHLCRAIQQQVIALGGIRFSTVRLLQHHQIIGIAIGQPIEEYHWN